MTRKTDVNRLRKQLQKRRRDILEIAHATHDEVRSLKEQDRDAEYEENAQVELADYTLSHLAENQRRELLMIDGALERMERGSYGVCVDCGEDISLGRLKALPFALRCEEDAEDHEARRRQVGALATPSL